MDPVEALERIAFLLEREDASTYRVKAFRGAADTRPLPRRRRRRPGGRPASPGSRASDPDRAGRHGGARRTHPRLPARTRERERSARSPRAATGSGPSCAGTATCTRTGPTAAARSRRWRRPRATSDTNGRCSPTTRPGSPWPAACRPTGCAPSSTSSPGSPQTRAVPAADRHRVRHPRRRRPGPGGRAPGPARRGRRVRPLQTAHGRRGDDPPPRGRRRQSAGRRPRPLHGPAAGRPDPPGVRVRRRPRVRRLRRRGTAVEINCRPERLDPPRRLLGPALEPAACSRSTPTRTLPASSTGRSTAARGPMRPASPPTAS